MTTPAVILREVGMRDGLQSLATVLPTADKIRWCRDEAAAGCREIEVCSFVPPGLLPQFADADAIVAAARQVPGLTVAALVPNLKGAERAIAAQVDVINFVVSVSESHNQANVRRSREQSLLQFAEIAERVRALPAETRPRLASGLSTAFGCTIEGDVSPHEVLRMAERLVSTGADEIIVADTVGYADPRGVSELCRAVINAVGETSVAIHLHDTRGLGLANALAAFEAGIRHFDASLGGLGGCPYAPGATGNIVMEDLAFMFEAMGIRTGIDINRLLSVRKAVEAALPGAAWVGNLARAGLPKGRAMQRSTNLEEHSHAGIG